MANEFINDCKDACRKDLTRLEGQLKAARRMVESGFNRTSIITDIEKKINNLQKKIETCSHNSSSPQK